MFPAPVETLRGHADKIAAERNVPQTGSEWPGRCRLPLNSSRDLLRELLPVVGIQRQTALGRISQESAFDEDRRNRGATHDIKAAAPDPAVLGRRAGNNIAMDALGESRAIA